MSITYINRSEYEKKFSKWKKSRTPKEDYVEASIATSIQFSANGMASDLIQRRSIMRTINRIKKEAKDSALWREYDETFRVGPIQPGEIVPVCGI